MANPIPEKLVNFRVYQDSTDLVGVADVTLPSLETMSDTIKGAAIAGELESPTVGHYKSMSLSLKWRTTTTAFFGLAAPKVHQLDLRGAIQVLDSASGSYTVVPVRIVVQGTPKKNEFGKFEVSSQMDSSTELELNYIKVYVDDEAILEIDKLNYICVIDGVDYMANIRAALGLE